MNVYLAVLRELLHRELFRLHTHSLSKSRAWLLELGIDTSH
jgi:hypothetical protein